MTKYKCDIKNCKKTATNFYYKGYAMGYHYLDEVKKNVRDKKHWLKLCDDCDIHREYLNLIKQIEESRRETDKLIKKAKELFDLK